MHDVSLLDQLLPWPGMLVELLILFLLIWVPIAEDLWMLRGYLCFSLISSTALITMQHVQSIYIQQYVTFLQVSCIVGHVFLVLISVELMAALINDGKRSVAAFYSLAIAAFLLSAISDLRFPMGLTLNQVMVFSTKAMALVGFILAFTLAFTKRYKWPYSGLAFGLAVMMLLDFAAVLARNWSAAHGWAHYGLIRYAFPMASDTGYLLWLRAVIVHKEPKRDWMSLQTLHKSLDDIRRYRAAVGDVIRKRTVQWMNQ